MDQLNLETAEFFFAQMPANVRNPFLNPRFIEADIRRRGHGKACFLRYQEGGSSFFHPFHLSSFPGDSALFDIESAYGYGGAIVLTEDKNFPDRAWKKYADWAAAQKVAVEFLRFSPFSSTQGYGGETQQAREHVYVDLTQKDLLSSYNGRARTAVKRAMAQNLRVCWMPKLERAMLDFIRIYQETMTSLSASHFYFFPPEFFLELLNLPSLRLAHCYDGADLVGAALFLQEGDYLEYYLSGASTAGKKKNATNLMLHQGFLLGQSSGCKIAHLGGGTSSDPSDPLFFFKSSFSPLRVPFLIGKRVYRQTEYTDFKDRWSKENRKISNRVLFYRD